MDTLKALNLALRFLLELGVLGALGYWGYRTGNGMVWKIILGIGAPIAAAAIWITLGAPGAALQLNDPLHLILEIIFFGGASIALFMAARRWLALGFAALFVFNRALMYVWAQ